MRFSFDAVREKATNIKVTITTTTSSMPPHHSYSRLHVLMLHPGLLSELFPITNTAPSAFGIISGIIMAPMVSCSGPCLIVATVQSTMLNFGPTNSFTKRC